MCNWRDKERTKNNLKIFCLCCKVQAKLKEKIAGGENAVFDPDYTYADVA